MIRLGLVLMAVLLCFAIPSLQPRWQRWCERSPILHAFLLGVVSALAVAAAIVVSGAAENGFIYVAF